jgi:MYXO-CTERM domain-containing protein
MLRPTICLLACAAVGCTSADYTLTDDIDLTWDFSLSRFDEDLHTPYVQGTSVTLFVNAREEDHRFDGWSVESDDPAIFRIDGCTPGESLTCEGQAAAEGVAALTVRDERGRAVGHGEAEVLRPDRVVLEAHGYLILGRDTEAPVDDLRILAGGTATYHVRYFRSGRELHGNGVLSAVAPAGITATPRTSFLFENREWLTLSTDTAAGSRSIELFADGVSLGTRALETVPEADIARVTVETQSERGREDGEQLVALAQAFDRQERRIFGVDFDWDLDGVAELGDGDLFRYKFKSDVTSRVRARRGSHSDTAEIHAEDGFVDSSNRVGCSAASGGASLLTGLALAGLVGFRRRRRR